MWASERLLEILRVRGNEEEVEYGNPFVKEDLFIVLRQEEEKLFIIIPGIFLLIIFFFFYRMLEIMTRKNK